MCADACICWRHEILLEPELQVVSESLDMSAGNLIQVL